MNKPTNWRPLVRHKCSQNAGVVDALPGEGTAPADALIGQSFPIGSVQEEPRLDHERVVKLEERTMPSVGIGQQHGIRQMLGQKIGVPHWNHVVEYTVHYQARLRDLAQLGEALTLDPLPCAKRGDLGLSDLRP